MAIGSARFNKCARRPRQRARGRLALQCRCCIGAVSRAIVTCGIACWRVRTSSEPYRPARHCHRERAADLGLALDRHGAAQQTDDPLHHTEAEARAILDVALPAIRLPERLEDLLQVLRPDADTGIVHAEAGGIAGV